MIKCNFRHHKKDNLIGIELLPCWFFNLQDIVIILSLELAVWYNNNFHIHSKRIKTTDVGMNYLGKMVYYIQLHIKNFFRCSSSCFPPNVYGKVTGLEYDCIIIAAIWNSCSESDKAWIETINIWIICQWKMSIVDWWLMKRQLRLTKTP